MSDISKFDKNFAVQEVENTEGTKFYNPLAKPMNIYGLVMPVASGKAYTRMPRDVAKTVSDGVEHCNLMSAGGRIRFKTDSSYVVIKANMPIISRMPHFALSGVAGFDLYINYGSGWQYKSTFIPPNNLSGEFESKVYLEGKMCEVLIHLPLYSAVCDLKVGVEAKAEVLETEGYTYKKPVVYYGSSITQGGCASRPGNAYTNVISREVDCDQINLGFSGNGKGEKEMADYIAGLDMSVFVLDYDHNAPTVEHLEKTHSRMYKTVREKQPELPIVMVSRPKARLTDEEVLRREVIKKTYDEAKAAGDENVYFIDGSKMATYFGGDDGTVDGVHCNDLGFRNMAVVIGEVVKKCIK